jgi:hypothetical protein
MAPDAGLETTLQKRCHASASAVFRRKWRALEAPQGTRAFKGDRELDQGQAEARNRRRTPRHSQNRRRCMSRRHVRTPAGRCCCRETARRVKPTESLFAAASNGTFETKEPISLFGLNGRFFAPAWAPKGAARRGCQDGPEAHAKRRGLNSPEHGAMLTAGWGIHNSGAQFPFSFPALGSWFFPGSAKAAATWLPGLAPLCPGRDHP